MEGQQSTKIATLMPSVRTLADSKLGIDLFRGSASWNFVGVPSSKVFGTMAEERLILFII
ncbi:hypothetical protein BHM03_00044937 [Ensete ventricosum]|uniref:Uncharacterized protein n=1 Tax=Ensete ventricosum TaxID=4639 RepID=A0A445MKX2_ENSVE|nr:hypothetical protein BHM03_00044937 [Ensete ventricosum]